MGPERCRCRQVFRIARHLQPILIPESARLRHRRARPEACVFSRVGNGAQEITIPQCLPFNDKRANDLGGLKQFASGPCSGSSISASWAKLGAREVGYMVKNAVESSVNTISDALRSEASEASATAPELHTESLSSFCAMPFQHICIGTEGTARICCMSPNMISDGAGPLSLYTSEFREIWNSPAMRKLRKQLLNAERPHECEVCYANESATSTSYRTMTGLSPLGEPIDLPALQREMRARNYQVDAFPGYLKLELGNLCNLKCRTCYGAQSSEIERDPVHTMWSGGSDPLHALWDDNQALIGPYPKIGIARRGIYLPEKIGDFWGSWTDGSAIFNVPISRHYSVERLFIAFNHEVSPHRALQILINGVVCFESRLAKTPIGKISIELSDQKFDGEINIEIRSEAALNPQTQRKEGLPIQFIVLSRKASLETGNKKEVLKSRFPTPGLWYKNDELLFGELLSNASGLRRFYVTGGEPFLEPRFFEIVDYLVVSGAASKIDFEINTNATVVDHRLLEKLQNFKSVLLMISLEGVGAVQEYIRYPSRWPVVEKNSRILRESGFNCVLVPVIQAYNMLDLADICEFAKEIDVSISLMNVLREPWWLRTTVMPANVQRRAAEKLEKFLMGGKASRADVLEEQLRSLVEHFNSAESSTNYAGLHTFNLFTNDLDLSRQQSFKKSLAELYELIADAGYTWVDDTLHANTEQHRRPARDRVHAWV
ncbi:hypothetical protein AMST5_00874 [freshwater sediment metagenome]|uniref:4Fe4S-binding SPASM domain-containing protein n=1 Tax=freshwater sediment metagenome TaxID=556182 RepID=A0AA48LYF1_9ZZZZ